MLDQLIGNAVGTEDEGGSGTVQQSYVNNGGMTEHGDTLIEDNFVPSLRRPFFDDTALGRGRPAVLYPTGEMVYNNAQEKYVPKYKKAYIRDLQERGLNLPVFNATTMRIRDWIDMDRTVVRAVRIPLVVAADFESKVGTGGFNGMAKLTHEYEAMTDPGEAVEDMDALADGRTDSPLFKLRSVPLPITHSDFWFSKRRLDVSRNSNTPLSTVMPEAGARRIGEYVEQKCLGSVTQMTFGTQTTGYGTHDGTSTGYGLITTPYSIAYSSMTTPTGSNPDAVLANVLAMMQLFVTNNFYGPVTAYYSTPYQQYFNNDYFRSGSTSAVRSLKQRLMDDTGITEWKMVPYLSSGFKIILVMWDRMYMEFINGMDITTVQWESQGGMRINFKIMAIKVPLIKAPYNGVTPIVYGS